MRLRCVQLFFFSLLLCVHPVVYTQQGSLLPRLLPDDPSSLFEYSIADSNVEFFADGYWESSLLGSVTLQFGAGEALSFRFDPLIFVQKVDFSTWVLIDSAWYFEAAFADGFARNTVAAGYISEDTIVRDVRIGNTGIFFPDSYTVAAIGGGSHGAPGIRAAFAGDNWNADTMIRYDTVQFAEKNFFGMNERTQTDMSVSLYEKGRWFVLPGSTADMYAVEAVYVQENDGSFRKLAAAEYSLNPFEQVLLLAKPCLNEILVHFSLSASALDAIVDTFIAETEIAFANSSAVSLDISDYMVDSWTSVHEGKAALLLRRNGFFSPFELASRYDAGNHADSFSLLYAETAQSVKGYAVTTVTDSMLFPDNTFFKNVWAEIYMSEQNTSPSYINAHKRFPLVDVYPWAYIPNTAGRIPLSDIVLRVQTLVPVPRLYIGNSAVAGTIRVYRDGLSDEAFSFDENTGAVTLQRLPSPFEHIRITWMNASDNRQDGSIVFASGFRWDFAENWSADIAIGTRWGISGGPESVLTQSGFASSSVSNPGSIHIASTVSYAQEEENESFDIRNTASFHMDVIDTSGYYQIVSMNDREHKSVRFEENIDWSLSALSPWQSDIYNLGSEASALGSTREFSISIRDNDNLISEASPYSLFMQLNVNPNVYELQNGEIMQWDISAAAASGGYQNEFGSVRITSKENGWKIVTIRFTDVGRSRFISSYTGMYFVISGAGSAAQGNTIDGTLHTQAYEILGTAFASHDTYTIERSDPTSFALSHSPYASIMQRFQPNGFNSVLEIHASGTFSAFEYVPAVPLSSYNNVSFFVYVPSSTTLNELTLTLDTRSTRGVRPVLTLSVPASSLASDRWHKVSLDLRNGSISVDDQVISSTVSLSDIDLRVSPTRVLFSGNANGIVYVTQVYASVVNPSYALENTVQSSWKKKGVLFAYKDIPLIADPSIAVSATFRIPLSNGVNHIYENPFDHMQAGGTTEVSVSLISCDVQAFFTRTIGETQVFSSAGHRFDTPSDFSIGFSERFSLLDSGFSAQKSNTLRVPFTSLVFEGNTKPSLTKQKVTARFKVPFAILSTVYTLDMGVDMSQSVLYGVSSLASEHGLQSDSYGIVWADMWGVLFSSGFTNASHRDMSAYITNTLTLPVADLKPSVQLQGKTQYVRGNSVLLKDASSITLSVPFSVSYNRFVVSWEKYAASSKPVDMGGSYGSDVVSYGNTFINQPWLWTAAPLFDMFSSDIPNELVQAVKPSSSLFYSSMYRFSWNKPLTSELLDFFIPTDVHIELAREIMTTSVDVSDVYRGTGKIQYSALNQFGSYSKKPLFKWFEQDETSQAYTFSARFAKDYFDWNATSYHSLRIWLNNSNSLKLENSFYYQKDGKWNTQAYFAWDRGGISSFIGELFVLFQAEENKEAARRNIKTKRLDSLKVEYGKRFFDAFTLDYEHVLTVSFSSYITCSATAGILLSFKKDEPLSLQNRLGISAKIQF